MELIIKILTFTSGRIVWENRAEKITLFSNRGQITVLKNHTPFVTALDVGITTIFMKSGKVDFIILGGFAVVKQNYIIIFANSLEYLDPANLNGFFIEIAYQEAKTKLENAETEKQRADAFFQYKRAKARYQLFKQYKN